MLPMIMGEHLEQEQNPQNLQKVYYTFTNKVMIIKEKVSARPSSAKIIRVKPMNLNDQSKVLMYHTNGTGRDTYISYVLFFQVLNFQRANSGGLCGNKFRSNSFNFLKNLRSY